MYRPGLFRPPIRWGRILSLMAVLGVVGWVGYAQLRSSTFGPNGGWKYDEETVLASPTGEHVAIVVSEHFEPYLGGAPTVVEVWVGDRGDDRRKLVLISRANGSDKYPVTWIGDNELLITADRIRRIDLSLHKATNVKIVYHLADGLVEEHYRQHLNEDEAGAEQMIRSRNSALLTRALSGDHGTHEPGRNQVGDIRNHYAERLAQTLKRNHDDYKGYWARYREFQVWARRNTDNGGP
jgi:hypothetical protein